MIILKSSSVKVEHLCKELIELLPKVDVIYQLFGQPETVITSGNDGKHMRNSLHYFNRAVDLRTYFFRSEEEKRLVAKRVAEIAGPAFDVVLESDHLHVEYDPK